MDCNFAAPKSREMPDAPYHPHFCRLLLTAPALCHCSHSISAKQCCCCSGPAACCPATHRQHWISPATTWYDWLAGRLLRHCNKNVSVSSQCGRRPAADCARVLCRKPPYIFTTCSAPVSDAMGLLSCLLLAAQAALPDVGNKES